MVGISEVAELKELEEIPAVCDYCYEEKVERAPDYHCVVCGYNFCTEHRDAHRRECISKLRDDTVAVDCSVEGCQRAVFTFYKCPLCGSWFCYPHREQHFRRELDKAEVKVEGE